MLCGAVAVPQVRAVLFNASLWSVVLPNVVVALRGLSLVLGRDRSIVSFVDIAAGVVALALTGTVYWLGSNALAGRIMAAVFSVLMAGYVFVTTAFVAVSGDSALALRFPVVLHFVEAAPVVFAFNFYTVVLVIFR